MKIEVDNFVYKLSLQNKKKRVVLKSEELMLLEELSHHRVLGAGEVHNILQVASNKPKNSRAITNRLRRLVNIGVLKRLVLPPSANNRFPLYFYKVGSKGLQVLVQTGALTKERSEMINEYLKKAKVPNPHNIATSILANKVKLLGFKEGFEDYQHGRSSLYFEKNSPIVPDWVFKRNTHLVCLEVDSGGESLSVIRDKYKKYIELAAKTKDKIKVVFSVMDGSVSQSLTDSERSKRTYSIKESAPPLQEWPANLSFYSLTAERTPALILRLIKDIEPIPAELRKIIVNDWVNLWKENIPAGNELYLLNNDEIYADDNRQRLNDADAILRVQTRNYKRTVAVLHGEEGSVFTYQKLRLLHDRTALRPIKGEMFNKIVLLYEDEEAAEKDVYGVLLSNAEFAYRGLWKGDQSQVKILRQVSPYRKEWGKFE